MINIIINLDGIRKMRIDEEVAGDRVKWKCRTRVVDHKLLGDKVKKN